jgi:hypothetical protein
MMFHRYENDIDTQRERASVSERDAKALANPRTHPVHTASDNVLRAMSARQLRALRHMNNGSPVEVACTRQRVKREEILDLSNALRDVPDRLLSDIECLLSTHTRLRRLLAALDENNGL